MAGKLEYRLVPSPGGTSMVPARHIITAEGYAMVRRSGAMPFVCTDREWQEGVRCTPEGIRMTTHHQRRDREERS